MPCIALWLVLGKGSQVRKPEEKRRRKEEKRRRKEEKKRGETKKEEERVWLEV
jgi:hypothetical protein